MNLRRLVLTFDAPKVTKSLCLFDAMSYRTEKLATSMSSNHIQYCLASHGLL